MKESFGQRFQRLRKSANLTQEDVANKLNITAQAVSKWENDVSAPDISVLCELSEILNVSLDELMGKESGAVRLVTNQVKPEKLFLRIRVLSSDGDKVNVNLPLSLVQTLTVNGVEMPKINGNDLLKGIDLKQLFALVEQGVMGKLVEVQSADGDTVEIWVESNEN